MVKTERSDVETAERIVADLAAKRDILTARGADLSSERQAIAYAAHTGDKAARKRLDAVNAESAGLAAEAESLDAAIAEANIRVIAAQEAAALAEDRERARELRATLADFRQCGRSLSETMARLVADSVRLQELLTKINALGAANPSHAQLNVLGQLALLTALRQTPWGRDFEPVAPNSRTDFEKLTAGWAAMIDATVSRRLGEPVKGEAA